MIDTLIFMKICVFIVLKLKKKLWIFKKSIIWYCDHLTKVRKSGFNIEYANQASFYIWFALLNRLDWELLNKSDFRWSFSHKVHYPNFKNAILDYERLKMENFIHLPAHISYNMKLKKNTFEIIIISIFRFK